MDWGPRIRTAAKALKRNQEGKRKRIPVTTRMLEWLAKKLRLGQAGTSADPEEIRIWIAIVVGFFFLLRVGELQDLNFEDLQPRTQANWAGHWGGR